MNGRKASVRAAQIALEHIGRALLPFLPETSAKIASGSPAILFPKRS